VKKQSIALASALALCCSLICSPARANSPVPAKTFVGVLWPMFGPFFAAGLVELVSEIKLMPNVEVKTYLHQNWPALVEDINRQPKGTRTLVVGYSLGANSTVFVANKVDYIDSIIALQPSMLSWNPDLTGKVGKIIEIYNPKPEMTFGGMGSKKLVGENIEYIANNDTHLGTQFSSQFRDLVKSEIARLATEDDPGTAQAEPSQRSNPDPEPVKLAPDAPNDARTVDSGKTKNQPHCETAAREQADREKPAQETPADELTTESHHVEPPHYGSLMWRAAATQEKKADELSQDIAGSAPCSD
jgi:hypothetical protein